MSCDNSNIRQNYIVVGGGESDIVSACTAFYVTNIEACDPISGITINSNIFIDGEIGHGAPWQWQLFNFDNYEKDETIIWEGKKQKLIFSHFSQFNYNLENDTYLPSSQHHIYTPLTMYTENKGLKIIYDDYFNKIKKTYTKYNT